MFTKIRPYQQDIIDKTLGTSKSTLIQVPTGGGKTLIAKEIAIKLINDFNKKILFIAPKIVLMEQTLDVFKGLKPQKVHGSNNKFDNNHHILVSTLQTASRRNSLNPDVIIIDEVHFGYEKKMLNKIMEYNPTARIIGLSATPYDENGYPIKGFDLIIKNYDIDYMIHNKYLVPIRSFILVSPDLSNVNIIAGDYDLNQLSEAVSKNTIIMEIVKTSKPFIEESVKTIVFAVDINHAELLKTAFLKEGIIAEPLHSKSEEDDVEVISRFKKGYIKVLVSVLKLTTGFDVPETDVAIIARPTKSQNLYKQMVGRIARLAQNKNYGILLDCGNVIENLGKPLDPIIPKDELDKKVQKLLCQKCDSNKIKLKKSDKKLFWECMDCGHKRELENRNLYKCENCKKKYDYEANFELVNNSLYLNCECGYETKISTATGKEKFVEVDSVSLKKVKNNEYLNFFEARKYVRKNIKSKRRWLALLNNQKLFPSFLPKNPDIFYKNEWISWEDWFYFKLNLNDSNYLSYSEAKAYLKDKNLKSPKQWKNYVNNIDFPNFIPKNPELFYKKNGWKGWNDWFGYLPFFQAREFARSLKLNSKRKWIMYCDGELSGYDNKPDNIPHDPYIYSKEGFLDYNDWLGAKKEYSIEQIALDTNLTMNDVIAKSKLYKFIIDKNSIIGLPLAKRIIELLS